MSAADITALVDTLLKRERVYSDARVWCLA